MYSKDATSKGRFTPKITVVGVGGAGGNAVNNMIASKLGGVNFLALNTDAQALENSLSTQVIQLGGVSTGGLGAGARPEIGRAAAEESLEEVMSFLNDQNMVFITAGMGGGTGTGAAPVIARACKERGILTVGVVTKPFQFEGAQRMRLADSGIDEMAQYVDTLIVIPNQNLFRIANEKTTFAEAFRMADNVLQSGVRGVTDLMVVPGMINLDFADVRSATSEMGKAMMGTGEASGDRRAIEAAEQAINNPLLDDVSMKGARSVIINISGGHDLTLFEIEEACNRINDEVDPDATIIFGSTYDDNLEGKMRITVVATGIEAEMNRRAASKPIRPMNYNVQPKRADEAQPLTDSFVTRYPEPSRHGYANTATSMNIAAPTVYAQPSQAQNFEVPEVQQNQSVAMAQDIYQMSEQQSIQDVGMTFETDYITEGSSVRKVEVQVEETHVNNYHNSVIPPYAPAKQDQVKMESSLVLNPPMRPVVQKETKKVPSLFERITGRHRDVESSETEDKDSSDSSSQGGFSAMSNQVERKTVMTSYEAPVVQKGEQGMLNIDAPSVQPRATNNAMTNEDLDIPAFLRRQIS